MDETIDESESEGEVIYLIGGDKCGNVHLFKIEKLKSHWLDDKPDDGEDSLLQSSSLQHLSLIKPAQSLNNLTKDAAAISAIYSRKTTETNKYSVVCCCQDGFYRVFEFDLGYYNNSDADDNDDGDEDMDTMMMIPSPSPPQSPDHQDHKPSGPTNNLMLLKMVNKYQINSYIDIIESFVLVDEKEEETGSFDLEKNLKLALCFYGDKFLLWSFQLARSLFEFRCGGANRSWDYEFQVNLIIISKIKFRV